MKKISLTALRELRLDGGIKPHSRSFLSAASGLVKVAGWLYVVADDELHIGVFPAQGVVAGSLFKVFSGSLPDDAEERKKQKPDLEAITVLPKGKNWPFGALLMLGSGSKKRRDKGALALLNKHGEISGEPEIIDLNELYELLSKQFERINIEGALVVDSELLLFQRGNKKDATNAVVRLALDDFFKLASGKNKNVDVRIDKYDLGSLNGIPLTFTDASLLSNKEIVFTAAAENTTDPVLDGKCEGSIVGVIAGNGKLKQRWQIEQIVKVEGVEAELGADGIEVLLVTDADNPNVPAVLYCARLN